MIADIDAPEPAEEKINAYLAAHAADVDGIVTTAWVPAVVAANALRKIGDKRIKMVGIDHDEVVLKAIKDGFVYGTMLQNPYGQGYVGSFAIDKLRNGCKVKDDAPWKTTAQTDKFIDSGTAFVSADERRQLHQVDAGRDHGADEDLRGDLPDLRLIGSVSAAECARAWRRLPPAFSMPAESVLAAGGPSWSAFYVSNEFGLIVLIAGVRAALHAGRTRLLLQLQPLRPRPDDGDRHHDRLLDDGGDRHRRAEPVGRRHRRLRGDARPAGCSRSASCRWRWRSPAGSALGAAARLRQRLCDRAHRACTASSSRWPP